MRLVYGRSARLHLKLLQDVANVLLDRSWAQSENDGYLAIALAFTQPMHHLALAWSEMRGFGIFQPPENERGLGISQLPRF